MRYTPIGTPDIENKASIPAENATEINKYRFETKLIYENLLKTVMMPKRVRI